MSDILLSTKTHIPVHQRNLVSRSQLVQRLNDGLALSHRLCLISAPAGYGKSTLLSEWVSQVHLPVAWLSLEASENSPDRFWNYFCAALSSVPHLHRAGIGEPTFRALQSITAPPIELLLANLVNKLSELEMGAVLVLDDLHTIKDARIHRDLVHLIDHLPQSTHSLHLVVSSRMDPPWPMARWRARNEVTELRSSDLRFTSDEIFQFLYQFLRLELSAQDVSALQARTEGWIAGLQMVAVSMKGWLDSQGMLGVSRFIEAFTGTNRFIMDYLMDEVINQQPAVQKEFLQATSILDHFSAPLCNTLLDREDSQQILDQLERANLFLVSLDDERQWYRYHHLFADLLRKHLKQTQPGYLNQLHQRASDWFARNHKVAEAIHHALEAQDFPRVHGLVSGNALAVVEHSELLEVLRHFEAIPSHQISENPWLGVAYAWIKAYTAPSAETGWFVQQIEQSLSSVEESLEKQHLVSHLEAVRAYVAWVKGESDIALAFAQTALASLPDHDPVTRALLLNIEGLALQFLEDIPAAIQSFKAAVTVGERTERVYDTFYAYTNWAFAEILQGRLRQAFSLCQHVLSLASQSHLISHEFPVLAYAYATMSMVQREWNQLDSAVASARQAVALAERWRQADTLHYSLTCLSEALCARRDLDGAFAANHRAMQLATHVSPWFVRISFFDEICLHLAKCDVASAVRCFAELEGMLENREKKGQYYIVKGSLLNAQEHFSDAVSALEKPIRECEQNGDAWLLLHLLPFQVLALHALGREEEAINVLARCLDYAEPEGFVNLFVARGAPMFDLLSTALKHGIQPEYINRLLAAFDSQPISRRPVKSGVSQPEAHGQAIKLLEPLSERELQVLRLLDSALTRDDIARELYISVNTVRTHIRNIYGKLGVNRRSEAVQRAKEIKIL